MVFSKPITPTPKVPANPTPFFEYLPIVSGDFSTPVLTHMTHGERDGSRIFHTKENGMYFEYHAKNITKKRVDLFCIYGVLDAQMSLPFFRQTQKSQTYHSSKKRRRKQKKGSFQNRPGSFV